MMCGIVLIITPGGFGKYNTLRITAGTSLHFKNNKNYGFIILYHLKIILSTGEL